MTVLEMTCAIEQYAECAGFADYYNRVLKNKSEAAIIEEFHALFKNEEDAYDFL